MPVLTELTSERIPVKIWSKQDDIEYGALTQLRNVAKLPWAFHHVAAMPDLHVGKGCVVGSVIAMKDAVSPAAVGSDLGCGMLAVRTDVTASQLPDSLAQIRNAIEKKVPVGMNGHTSSSQNLNHFRHGKLMVDMRDLWAQFGSLHEKSQSKDDVAKKQMGSLGGGNHMLTLNICQSDQSVWIMLHSGSRNIGKTLADIHISIARKLVHNHNLPDPDLAVFLAGTDEMKNYRRDLMWAQDYARLNRYTMMEIIKDVFGKFFPGTKYDEAIHCHHNYVAEETHFGEQVLVTRKGAIRAGKGDLGIIPSAMGGMNYIVRGLGNPDSFDSASHGAGRRMSRGQAKRHFTEADLVEQTKGIECRKDTGVLDEIPGAYKDIKIVMQNQTDLVEVVHEIKEIMTVKG